MRVLLNGVLVADETFGGRSRKVIEVGVNGLLLEGPNTLSIVQPADTGMPTDIVVLESFSATYPRSPLARNGTLRRRTTPRGGQPPVDWRVHGSHRDLRASQPTGPASRTQRSSRVRLPSLEEARGTILGFGRFHGLSLGEVAEREPTYIDWIASTITRDRDLVLRARVIARDLDDRGIERRPRAAEA